MMRILLVDQYLIVRTGIRRLLADEADMEVVGEASSGEEAVSVGRAVAPDLVVLDVSVADMSGLEMARRLLRLRPVPTLVALSTHRDGPYPIHLLDMGVTGYLTKDCDQAELIRAIRKTGAGERYVSADVARSMVLGRLESDRTPISTLTPRELSVMVMVAQGHQRAEISSTLSVSPKTVSTYRTRILRKLGAQSDVELTHLSLRHGLIEPWQGDHRRPA